MPNWLAITWDSGRLMLLGCDVHNGTVTFNRLASFSGAVPQDPSPAGGSALQDDRTPALPRSFEASLKKQLNDYVQKNRLSKTETIVILSRSQVEVRPMMFPPVPLEELPDMVRFQAVKEFNGYDPSSPLDFFITNKLDNVSRSTLFPAARPGKDEKGAKTPKTPGSPKHLLASTLRLGTYQKIEKFCEDVNLTLRRIVLRPCETAYLWRQSSLYDPVRAVLLVELDVFETSQAVLFQGEPIFLRSPKISCPEDVSSADFVTLLVSELKRTRIAVRNEIQGVTVDEIVLCGAGKNFESLAAQVSENMGIPVHLFDPWKGVSLGGELRKAPKSSEGQPQPEGAELPERYASLIGTLLQASKGEAGNIDFCNPKKRPEPKGHRQLITGAVAAGMLLFIGLVVYGFIVHTSLTQEVQSLTSRHANLQSSAVKVAEQRSQLAAIDAWQADEVDWFRQLDWLSRNAPGSRDLMLTELTLNANNGGSMDLKTLLKDSSVVLPMEQNLRDANHEIRTGDQREDRTNPLYGFRYNFTISLDKNATPPPPSPVVENPLEPEAPGEGAETGSEAAPPQEEAEKEVPR